ncbi:MAG: Ig-like domain-containing protein, partial [Anaerolineae bacterium]
MRRVFMFAAIIVTLLVLAFQVEPSVGQNAAPPTEEIRIAQALPTDGSENIPGNVSITVVFNRPIAPLGTSIDQASLPQPLVFDPPIDGHGEWINTSIYEFHPSSFLPPNTTYHVTINAGLTSADGAVLAADYQWSFQTATPTLHRIAFGTPERPQTWYTQNNNQAVTLRNPSIWFYFGGQVDPAAIEPAIFIRRLEQPSGSVSGTVQWQDSLHTMISFTPDELLDMDTAYIAGIDFSRLPPHSLTLPEGGRAEVAFRTVPYPSIVSTDPVDGTENAGGGFTVHFATPMDAESIAGRITVDPQPEALNEYYQYDQYYLAFPVQPRTTYTITLPPGMRDIYGNEIANGQTIHFTSAPPSPNATLNTPGLYGFFNAYNANTGVYLTYRNVESVDLDLYTLRVDQFLDVLMDTDGSVWEELGSLENRLLRSWTIHLTGPQDTEIPHYLSLGSSDECVGAPQPRLAIGADAEVIAERGMAQAMSAAGADEISAFLYPGVSFPVVGGPLCIDRRTWWELQTGQDFTSWVAESGDHGYVLEHLPLTGQTISVRGDQDSALAAGIYMLNMAYQASPNYRPAQTHFMMVMTANLIVQASPDEVLVWATDVQTGQPIANAPITVYSQGHGAVAAGVTDEDGLLQVRVPRIDNLTNQAQIAVLRTADQFGIGSTRWADGVDPGNFGLASNFAPPHYRIYAYTDRPIYRPGQTAYFRAIVRSVDDVAYFPPDLDSVPVQISQGDQVIFSREVPLTPYGTLSGSFTIPEDSYGYYQLMVTIPTALDQNPESTTISFSVGEYRLPEFQVSMTPQPNQLAQGEDIHVQVNSRYFFDAPVSDARVEYRVIVQPYAFQYQGDGYYQFYDRRADADSQHFGRVLLEDEGHTDAQGMYDITFPANLLPAEYSQLYTIEATVFDQTTGTVSEQTQMIVHAGRVYVGGRPDSYVGYADEPLNINLIAVDWNSHGIAEQPIDIEVIERRYHSVQEVDSSGRATWTSDIEEIPISQGHVITGEDGKSVFNFTPPNGGSYEVRLTTHDSEGHTIHSTVYVWAAGTHYVPMQQRNNHRIDLIADQEQYQIGDTAAILITSPFQGTHEALITVERGSIFTVERITLTSNTYVYHVPITGQHVPNVFVSVILIKGVDDTNPVADFRMGLVQLSVDPSQRHLNVEISADRDRAEPSGNVTFTVRTTDSTGHPVAAEIGAALTDIASLSVLRPDTRQLMD